MFAASSSQVSSSKLYVDDVFHVNTRTGTGAIATVTNGIDLAGYGGLVWSKSRSSGVYSHALISSVTALTVGASNLTNAFSASGPISAFNSNGFTLGATSGINASGELEVDFVFRKAPKFFDVVTFTTSASSTATIAHSLGSTPGMVIVKCTGAGSAWYVWHQSIPNDWMYLNVTNASAANPGWCTPSSTSVSLSGAAFGWPASTSFVAYIFAHDTSADGIIQCGSYIGTGSAGLAVTLGFEPQLVLLKDSTNPESWYIWDTARGLTTGAGAYLNPSTSAAEVSGGAWVSPTATGFSIISATTAINTSASKVIYLAIRRPNKPPTTGTQVYNAIAFTGDSTNKAVNGVGFPPDVRFSMKRSGSAAAPGLYMDRLRGGSLPLSTSEAISESAAQSAYNPSGNAQSFLMDGCNISGQEAFNGTGNIYINHFFRRAPGCFDQVCYTGTAVAGASFSHNLGAVPELMIVRNRAGGQWVVYVASLGNTLCLQLHLDLAPIGPAANFWNNTSPTSSAFTLGSAAYVNGSGNAHVAYLFATLAGISKVFSFTGNGTNQNIDCGFSTGARFVLLKRTDSTGNWLVADTARGLVSGNDPSLALNSTAAEVTTLDWIDPYTGGFNIVQESTNNANVNGATYIGLAFS